MFCNALPHHIDILRKIANISFFNIKENIMQNHINPLSAKFIKWSNTLKQFVGKLPTNCLSVFDHFSGLALKGLNINGPKIVPCSTHYCSALSAIVHYYNIKYNSFSLSP